VWRAKIWCRSALRSRRTHWLTSGARLDRARWAPGPQGGDEGYGVPKAFLQRLVAHWREHYDWRVWEGLLNQYPPPRSPARDGTC